MYQTIVFLPLLGAILAALISLTGARARHPGGMPGATDPHRPRFEPTTRRMICRPTRTVSRRRINHPRWARAWRS